MFLLYEIILFLVAIVALPWFLVVGLTRGKYLSTFSERLGRYRSAVAPHDLWIHAVSVGEVGAAKAVLDRVLQKRPSLRLLVTTTTATGQATARKTFPGADVSYFPFDFSFSVRRFLDHHKPRVFASVETEIWPNTVRQTHGRGIPLLLMNARLSDRSYPRYRALRLFLRPILSRYSAILARGQEDRDRFVRIGATPRIVEVTGNVKFDFVPDFSALGIESQLREWMGPRLLFVAGSTMAGEDEELIRIIPRLVAANHVIAIAPRKPERFAVVAELLRAAGIPFFRRSTMESSPARGDVVVMDSFGELARLYRLASVAFIGGSLIPSGGHNPIEAAAVGTPVAFGPHMSNFRDVAATFLESGAAREVKDAGELEQFVITMAKDSSARQEMSRRALDVVERNRGAAERNAQRLVELLG